MTTDHRVSAAWERARKLWGYPWFPPPRETKVPNSAVWPTWLLGNEVHYSSEGLQKLQEATGWPFQRIAYVEFVHQLGKACLVSPKLWVEIFFRAFKITNNPNQALLFVSVYLDFATSLEIRNRGFLERQFMLKAAIREKGYTPNPTLMEVLTKALLIRLGVKCEQRYPPHVESLVSQIATLPYSLSPEDAIAAAEEFFRLLAELFAISEPDTQPKSDQKSSETGLVGPITVPPGVVEYLEKFLPPDFQETQVIEFQNLLISLTPTPEAKIQILAALSPWRKYLAKAEEVDLRLPVLPNRSHGSSYPFSVTQWTLDDPLETLAPTVSPLGARVVPGFVYRWLFRSTDLGYPNALVIIDASGSMGNPFEFSPGVCGAIAVARAFLLAGSTVTALSSSDHVLWATARGLSQATSVYKVLAAAQRGAYDRLDSKVLQHVIRREVEKTRTLAVVFTDGSVWVDWVPGLRVLREEMLVTHVFVLGKAPEHLRQLVGEKFHVHEVTSKSWEELRDRIKRFFQDLR